MTSLPGTEKKESSLLHTLLENSNEATEKLRETRLRFQKGINLLKDADIDDSQRFIAGKTVNVEAAKVNHATTRPNQSEGLKSKSNLNSSVSISCPHCSTKLKILPKTRISEVRDRSKEGYFDSPVTPDGAGDREENEALSFAHESRLTKVAKQEQNFLMSSMTTINAESAGRHSVRAKLHSLSSNKSAKERPLPGKNMIFRLPGSRQMASDQSGNRLERSRSFVVASTPPSSSDRQELEASQLPRALERNYVHNTNGDMTYFSSEELSSFPCFRSLCETDSNNNLIIDKLEDTPSDKGLDKVEVVSLYESSASSSASSLTSVKDTDSTFLSLFTPSRENSVQPNILSNYGFAVVESEVDTTSTSTNTIGNQLENNKGSNNNITFDFDDIPKYRRDLYKNSFQLFIEKYLGKQ